MPRPKGAAGAKGKPVLETAAADDAPVAVSQQEDAPAKKKRNNNPGVRVQGGRVYDSENGTTCHQCRQKTAEIKAKCTKCTLYFCPKCLENRYQEEVAASNAKPGWACPRCRGDCNCSNCRKKLGMEATGQLAAIAKRAGFGSVSGLLQKNPNAKAIKLPKLPGAAPGAASGNAGSRAGSASGASRAANSGGGEPGGGEEAAAAAAEVRKRAQEKRKAAAAAAELELLADEELPPRQQEMPEAQPLAVHKSAGGAVPGTKRQRGGLSWVADVPAVTAVPEGPAGAELAVVLEFMQVFGAQLRLRTPSLTAFAAELLQPAVDPTAAAAKPPGRGKAHPQAQLLCPSPEDSLVAAVHCKLLDLVRAYWNVKGVTTPASWQGAMRGYWAASLLTQRQAAELRWGHGPPAVAGQIFTRPSQHLEGGASQEQDEVEEAGEDGQAAAEGGDEEMGEAEGEQLEEAAALGAGGAAAIPAVDYPEGGYWALPVAARVGMLHTLIHDALECGELREFIEGSMGDAEDEEKERRQELAGVRKEAREAIARERDQQIALMIASATTGGLTLEQQQQMLGEARERAEAAAATAAAARVKSLGEKVHPPTVRAAVVGSDREGRRYLQLQAAPLLTGDGGVIVQSAGAEGLCGDASEGDAAAAGGATESLCCYPSASLEAVAAALHPQGRREGPLRAALVRTFKLPAAAELAVTAAAAPTSGGSGSRDDADDEDAGQQGQSRGAGPAAGEPQAPAGGSSAAAGQKGKPAGGGKKAGGRSKSGSPSAVQAAAVAVKAPAGGKRRRDSGDGGAAAATERAAPKRQRGKAQAAAAPAAAPPAAAACGKKGSRRASQQGGTSPDAGAGKAAAAAPKGGRKAGGRHLPLKVDDLLVA